MFGFFQIFLSTACREGDDFQFVAGVEGRCWKISGQDGLFVEFGDNGFSIQAEKFKEIGKSGFLFDGVGLAVEGDLHGNRMNVCVEFSTPLGELLGEGALFAGGEVFETEIVVELEKCLLVGDTALEGFCCFFAAEEADATAFEFLVYGGVALLVVITVGEAVFVNGEWNEVIGGKLESEVFPKNGNRCAASDGSEGVVVGPEFVLQAVEKVGEIFDGEGVCEGQATERGPFTNKGGKAADAAVRVVCGTLAVGFPGWGSAFVGFMVWPDFPPGFPQVKKIFTGVLRCP